MYINAYKPQGTTKNGSLISLKNVLREDLFEYLYRTREFKRKSRVGEKTACLTDKYVALIAKSSYFRTKIAIQIATESLGGKPLTISLSGTDIAESLKDRDACRNLRDYGISAFIVDTSYFHDAEILEHYAGLPILNANAKVGPCHAIASLYTAWEHSGKLTGLRMAYIGDTSDEDNSLLIGAAKCGVSINLIAPEDRVPSSALVDYCRQFCDVEIFTEKDDGLRGCDMVYVSENDFGADFLLHEADLSVAHKDAFILHSVPITRGKDISDDAVDSPRSLVFEQSTNLIPALQAALSFAKVK